MVTQTVERARMAADEVVDPEHAGVPEPRFQRSPANEPLIWPELFTHAVNASPSWANRIKRAGLDAAAPPPEAIDAFLEANASVPRALRVPPLAFDLYQGRAKVDTKMRLVGAIFPRANPPSGKKLALALRDPSAAGLELIHVKKRADLGIVLDALDEAPFTLRALGLSFAPSEGDIERIGTHPKLASLEALSIMEQALEDRIELLARQPVVRSLRHLALWCVADKAPKRAFDALAEVPFERLETFTLTTNTSLAGRKSASSIVRAPWLGRLSHLTVEGLNFDDEDIEALAQRDVVPHLRTLSLRESQASPEILCALLRKLSSCESLSLQFFRTGAMGDRQMRADVPLPMHAVDALIESGCVPNLVDLMWSATPETEARLAEAGRDWRAAKAKQNRARGL